MNTDDPTGSTHPAATSSDGGHPDLSAVLVGPPWSVELLADLHAGRYPTELAGELRRRIAGDPSAAAVLTALDATVDQLSLLPTPRMPERFALRLDAAIAAEQRAAAGAGNEAGSTGGRSTGGRSVPQPRQAADESVTAAGVRGQQAAGGQSVRQWTPPPVAVPPVLPFRQSGPPPLPPTSDSARRPSQPALPTVGFPATASGFPATSGGLPATGRPTPAHPGLSGASGAPGSVTPGDPGAQVRSLDAARTKRRRWAGGLAAAAAAIVIGTAAVASLQHPGGAGSQAAAPAGTSVSSGSAANALELDPGRIGDALKQIEGRRPVGPLQNATTYSRCLAANVIDPSAVSGVTSATFEGRPAAAIAVVIDPQHSRIVVVGPACGVDGAADQLAAQTVTR